MPRLPWLVLLRVATLVALCASAALASDYLADAPSFCSASSGCGAVRASPYSRVLFGDGKFLPLPAFGLLAFALSYAASMLAARATTLLALGGGLIALWLLYVQAFVLRHFCWLCVTTDVSALLAALSALGWRASSFRPGSAARLAPWAWWGLAALSLLAPFAWPMLKASPAVPGGVLRYYAADKLNVVEFADFQCPACRRFHGVLEPTLKKYGNRVHFVRLNKPLDSHAFARDAARAAVCGEAQGKLEQTADALFKAPDLSQRGLDRVAEQLGLDSRLFEDCMAAPGTDQRVGREAALLPDAEFEGLPTTYIGGKRLLGVRSAEELEDALERAARGEGVSGVSAFVYVPALALLALLLLRFGLRRDPRELR